MDNLDRESELQVADSKAAEIFTGSVEDDPRIRNEHIRDGAGLKLK